MFSNNNRLLNLALPGFEVSEPLVGSVIAKGFIGGGVVHLIVHRLAWYLQYVGVVVFVGRLLADNVLLWYIDCQSNGLALPFQRVGRGIVGTPAGSQKSSEPLTLIRPVEKR